MMRLLERREDGSLNLEEYTDSDIPAYAVLSHTWATDNSHEVTFQDIEAGTAHIKPGYKKIMFSADKTAADGLRWFWIDTCCIDKKNAVELSAAINSMFKWYQRAARCYVYLTDVSFSTGSGPHAQPDIRWEDAFRRSRWFQRGWTLQELIAPTLVDFFSAEGVHLGSKAGLEALLHDITGIARNALHSDTLSSFTIEERMSWAERRITKLEEDQIYSLLGIFNISMSLIYGEGKEKASRRLYKEIFESYKGVNFEQFTVAIDLSTIPKATQFVAREQELAEMYKLLFGHSSQSAVVLHGLGGIGKSQLAVEFMMRHKEKYTALFWLNANNANSLKLSFRGVAQQILTDHPSSGPLANVDLEGDLNKVVAAVKKWLDLRQNKHWLVIYNNYDNPKIPGNTDSLAMDIRQYLPQSDHGSIIITTRSSQVTNGQRLPVQRLVNVDNSLEILSNTCGRKGITSDPAARELAEKLDGLPLALATAGAYLEHMTTSFSEYLWLWNQSWLGLQQTTPQVHSYEDRHLYTTWQITLDRIGQQNPASARLLKLWAYFDRHDLWFGLLQHADRASDQWIQMLAADVLNFNGAIRLLCNYGLVDTNWSSHQSPGASSYSVHSCVHSWAVHFLNKRWDESLAHLAITCIASEIPDSTEKDWWLLQQRLFQHVIVYQQLIEDRGIEISGIEWELHRFGNLYMDQGKLAEAEQMYTHALQGKEEALGPKHTSTLDTVNNLGNLYANQGKLAAAEQMYTHALQGYKGALRLKHTSTLSTVNNLGLLYANQGKLAEAEQMYTRALQGKEEAFGPKHTSTLSTVNNLGSLYANQGKLAEAEQMYTRALQGYEEALGLKHTSTLSTVNNLGRLYANQGKLAEAEQMYTRALQGKEEAFGLKHTSTLSTVNNLGSLYANQGKLAEAEQMYTRALQGYEEALGPKHTSTLYTVNNLGLLYTNQGRLAEAEQMYTRALQGKEEALGPKHTSTLSTINNLGNFYADQGKLAEAEQMYTRALQGKEEALGLKHTSTLDMVNNLGLLFAHQGKLAEAEQMYTRALQGYEEALGTNVSLYIPALKTCFNLGGLFSATKRADKARAMYTRALSGFATVQGPSSDACEQIETCLKALESTPTEAGSENVEAQTQTPKSKPVARRILDRVRRR